MSTPNVEALKSDIRAAVINQKANACPMIVRLAWHASGTYDKNDGTGGSDGAGMRYEPESIDGANAGLSIARDMLKPVKEKNPDLSIADIWTFAGASAVEFCGGPKVPHNFGRSDWSDGSKCVANGRLPDAAQGAQHLRDVFYRQGFNDQEIVILSGAHTLGRCHMSRSGFDGPWTRHPLKFDNQYFKNLLELKWVERKWDGPLQYTDEETEELMMLPTDIALTTDEAFRPWVETYAADEQRFFRDFADAFAKLMQNGAPIASQPDLTDRDKAGLEFREACMHGSLPHAQKWAKEADVHQVEASSGRTALHKAAFWGHIHCMPFLLDECKIDVNAVDFNGDTAMHDAARFGHAEVVQALLDASGKADIKNNAQQTVLDVAVQYEQQKVVDLLKSSAKL